jgi:hypothetical protein
MVFLNFTHASATKAAPESDRQPMLMAHSAKQHLILTAPHACLTSCVPIAQANFLIQTGSKFYSYACEHTTNVHDYSYKLGLS